MVPPLIEQSPSSLTDWLEGPGRAREVFRALARGEDPHHSCSLAASLRNRLTKTLQPIQTEERSRVRSPDGTTKLLLDVRPGTAVETVLIPEESRTTLCVSSQVGCVRGCRFCLTATMGLDQNLSAGDILSQVHAGLRVCGELGLPPLRNLVFMGMGEPLDNWASVRSALDILLDGRGYGFGPRHVTVSTVAPTPRAVEKLAETSARIAWSLHAARDPIRRNLIASARHDVADLRDAFADVLRDRRASLFVEMTLMRGVNDAEEDARAAAALFEGFPTEVRFNLLPMNPTGRGLEPASSEAVEAFASILRESGYFTKVRRARGEAESSACGQLAVALPSRRRPGAS